MALPLYLAMTAVEIDANSALPPHFAYMACHFSPYSTGLSNLPEGLPPGGMLILNDRIPYWGHDLELVTVQLRKAVEQGGFECVLLDLQRPDVPEAAVLAERAVAVLPCPTAVALPYGKDMDCPVFLPPVPPDCPPEEYLAGFSRREVWLEAALDRMEIRLTEDGAASFPGFEEQRDGSVHRDEALFCHYQTAVDRDVRFSLFRTREDLGGLMQQVETYGVTRAVGLWQELRDA